MLLRDGGLLHRSAARGGHTTGPRVEVVVFVGQVVLLLLVHRLCVHTTPRTVEWGLRGPAPRTALECTLLTLGEWRTLLLLLRDLLLLLLLRDGGLLHKRAARGG